MMEWVNHLESPYALLLLLVLPVMVWWRRRQRRIGVPNQVQWPHAPRRRRRRVLQFRV